jgi:mannose-6-phosphate isomerase-like protein (cupin superfamily)
MLTKVNLGAKFSLFTEHWTPKIIGEVNDLHVKIAKIQGEFPWHHHENEDELFYVVKGALRLKVREHGRENEFLLMPGEFLVVPRGTEHQPSAEEETHILMLEPKTTLNTGNLVNERTVSDLERL